MADIPVLETDRLLLRGWRVDDIEPFARVCADAETMRFIGDGSPMPPERGWAAVAGLVGHWGLRGFGQWAVEDRETGALLGRVGLHHPPDWPGTELGWLLDRQRWGEGLATEAATAARDWAFATSDLPELISLIQPGNAASVRVAEKLGMRRRERIEVGGHPADVYALTRDRR